LFAKDHLILLFDGKVTRAKQKFEILFYPYIYWMLRV